MKTFTTTSAFNNWIKQVVIKTNKQALEDVARQEYKDSKKYTYIDTEAMYKSGSDSDFKKGYVIERMPYVKMRYYIGGKPRKNKMAVPQWHEATKKENMNSYKKIYNDIFKKMKG